MTDAADLTWREKANALARVARYRPLLTFGLVLLGGFVAFFEGVGLGFIYPIIEVAQAEEPVASDGPVMDAFIAFYEFAGIPFTLGYLILGVAAVMTFRYTMSFLVAWLKGVLSYRYEQTLRARAFEHALGAEVGYFDEEGSDDVLNAIITETRYSGKVIQKGVELMETLFLILMYFAVMLYITPSMTVFAVVLLGGITILLRFVVEPAVTVGTRVAEANERVQESVQAGTQGIRDVKLFGLADEVFSNFFGSVEQYATSSIELTRNEAAIDNFYRLSAAVTLFVLIYIGFVFTGLSLGELGIFLIAMFQLAPQVSKLNSRLYSVEGHISHLVRTQKFLDQLEKRQETDGERSVPDIQHISFDNVHFSYDNDETILNGISFEVEKGELVAFVGQSGAGKSTIVSLLAQMYRPDSGEIRANSCPIEEYSLEEWRESIAVVRQQPFIFNDTLENNITIGNRDATREDIERVCRIAKVDEFVDELPDGYESQLGDDGVRLSGGQRQRVALARALLKDADFLVLDEATSDLDSSLEREVQAAIEAMDREYGIIAIAHRLSTVKNADRIHTVDDGEIIESGTHDELLNKEGEYAELYTIQSRG
ncbi:ABC transporter ATP-binding protein [Natrarchaeobius halalkaliphilus]|uniref:ABC transporter ATP-binding protein n=1 Tax=Natrarchaeobius halalkaliphilus TaxID=1679091 RepID=A0A3N6P9T9_9EURY|nr:ABC transporter ATP-binding protein [Natrarchaeobius halalkaliphilus]RQG93055.1 ABC transporter ATP-binding protein [Natrarchaeobius halalkaliphilus]